jgi:hypothetical protein
MTKYYSEVNKYVLYESCNTYVGEDSSIHVIRNGDWGEKDHFGNADLHENIIFKWIIRKWNGASTVLMWIMTGSGGRNW